MAPHKNNKDYENSNQHYQICSNLYSNNRLYITLMLIVEKIILVKGDSKEAITRMPVEVEGLTAEEFKANVKQLFRCDRVLLTYTVKEEENENENQEK